MGNPLITHSQRTMMKLAIASLMGGSATAFSFFPAPAAPAAKTAPATPAFSVETMPGALAPVGFFDPLGFAANADENTLKRYGEAVEGSSFLFDAQISGPAISHFEQIPDGWDAL